MIQETDQVVWYSHLFKNFPQFVVIHTVKGSDVVNEAKVDVFLEFSCFFHDPTDKESDMFIIIQEWYEDSLVWQLL